MYVQFFLLVIGLGIIFTYAREHGCGASCPLPAPPGQPCSCVCATCPCSPADRIHGTLYSLPGTMKYYYDAAIRVVKPRNYTLRSNRESDAQFPVFPDLSTLSLTDYVIEDSQTAMANRRSTSLPNFTGRPSAAGTAAVGGTSQCGVQTSKLKHTSISNKLDEDGANLSSRCRKCKEKGVTCMIKCPKAKK